MHMVVYVHEHGHRLWKLHCASLGLGMWWFESLQVQCRAACDGGHQRSELAWPSAWQVVDTTRTNPTPFRAASLRRGKSVRGPAPFGLGALLPQGVPAHMPHVPALSDSMHDDGERVYV